jgi:hypothetical protein
MTLDTMLCEDPCLQEKELAGCIPKIELYDGTTILNEWCEENAHRGFLPPSDPDHPTRGEGSFSFSVRPGRKAKKGWRIRNIGVNRFDGRSWCACGPEAMDCSGYGAGAGPEDCWVELELTHCLPVPENPTPADGARNVELPPTFGWTGTVGPETTYTLKIWRGEAASGDPEWSQEITVSRGDEGWTQEVDLNPREITFPDDFPGISGPELDLNTTYSWRVEADDASCDESFGKTIAPEEGAWTFTTIPQPRFHRHDANIDGTVDLSDPIRTLAYMFLDSGPLPCESAADSNDDGQLDISDPICTLINLFGEGCGSPISESGCVVDPDPGCLEYDKNLCGS